MGHKHEFTALWWHYGPFGPQDVHLHGCFGETCQQAVVGPGRDCDGKLEGHVKVNYGNHRKIEELRKTWGLEP